VEWLEVYPEKAIDRPRMDHTLIEEELKNRFRQELKDLLERLLEQEAEEQLGAVRYERGILGRRDYRNGHRSRWLGTSLGTVELKVPRARELRLSFTVFEAYQRRWRELDELLLEAYIGGMSCRAVAQRVARRLGSGCSGSTVAQLVQALEQSLRAFRDTPLADEYVGLVLDGMYLRIKQCGAKKRPVVVVLGVKADGTVELLAVRVCYSENSTEVEGTLRNLKERGVRGANLKLVTLDGDKGLEAAVYSVYGHVRIQDCVFHRINRLHRNAQSKRRGRRMMQEASKAFAQTDPRAQRKALQAFCDRWRVQEPQAIERFQDRLERCGEVHQLDPLLRSRLSTTNLCEDLFKQIRRRTNGVGSFETPAAVELFVFAIVCQKTWINIPGRTNAAPLLSTESPHES
jgi:transposase-like protein